MSAATIESEHGRDEAAAKNNHGTYYDVQVASFAQFVGKTELAKDILQTARQKRIAQQIVADGRQPLELARTKGWSYSIGNLDGLMLLARLGENVGVNLWNFETPDGRSIHKALDFLLPFAAGDRKWPYQQLGGCSPRALSSVLRRAALKYPDPRYRALLASMPVEDPASRSHLLRSPLSRNDAAGNGVRDGPGSSVRRLAEQMGRPIPLTDWYHKPIAAGASAGRRRQRSRRPRSPSATASIPLRTRPKTTSDFGAPSPWPSTVGHAFSVVAGILPAVEPGILPGGMGVWFEKTLSIAHLGSGRQDAALYGGQDGRRYGRERHAEHVPHRMG